MNTAHVDFECYSELDVTKVGAYRYAEHPSTEMLCIGYAINDEHPELWIPFDPPEDMKIRIEAALFEVMPYMPDVHWGHGCPENLRDVDQYRAHNAQFERVVGNSHVGQLVGFPETEPNDWVCTAAKAAAAGLPRDLERVCRALRTVNQKNQVNKKKITKLWKPRKPLKAEKDELKRLQEEGLREEQGAYMKSCVRHTWENAFQEFIWHYEYNIDDVLAERDVDHDVRDLSPREQKVWELDQVINDRGVKIDMPTVECVQQLIGEYKELLAKRCLQLTGFKPTQRERLQEWLNDGGCDIENLQADTIRDRLKKEPSKLIRTVLTLYRTYNMKAPSKYAAMQKAVCEDGRLRGMFMYHGAGTGRWSSKFVQLQNLFRGIFSEEHADELVLAAIRLYELRDLEAIRLIFNENPMQIFASTTRAMLIASEGRIFRCADYRAIEGRVTAWLARQEDKLEIYRTHGYVYEDTAIKIFNMHDMLNIVGDPSVTQLKGLKHDHPDERFAGKTAELALGFQGAVAALNRMAKREGKLYTTEEALRIVRAWREANSKIRKLWSNLDAAAVDAVANPGKVCTVGVIKFRCEGRWLYMRLPSGRKLGYFNPRIVEGKYGSAVGYWGINTETRKWEFVSTYGGRLTENAAQATARDLLANAMLNLEKHDYNVVGTVHDEVIEDADPNHGSLDEMCEIMCMLPAWATDLPVEAAGWEGLRFKKD